jgi:SH3-like domain-containing protein
MRLLRALALAAAAGCSRSPPPASTAGQPASSGATAETAAAAPKGPTAYLNAVTVLRREASEAAKIQAKPGAKDVANYLALLFRGEKVAVIETREDWARVRASDDREGWLKRSALLETEGATEATVLAATDVFDRPDLLAANARRKIDPGTLVLVVKSKPPFSEVNVSGGQDAWVLSDRLDTSEREVSVAKLVEKSRYLVRSGKKDEALQNLALARQEFAGAKLLDILAAELGQAPAAPADAGQPSQPAEGLAPDGGGK